MAYSTISYGSSGDDVRKLQKSLNEQGYSLSVDGVFGNKTRDAVRDYQKNNGLSVDGIVGQNTWNSLSKKASGNNAVASSDTNKTTSNSKIDASSKRPEYEKGQAVKNAEKELSQWENSKPDEYKSKYSDEIDALLNEILNRPDFEYDMQADPLYNQYRQLYMENGERAMRDTVGQVSSLTGGYGNSYAVSAGNQAYSQYLDEINEIALELRDRAYDMYTDEGGKLIEDVTLLRNLDGDDYEKYLTTLEQYYSDGDYLLKKLSQMSDAEFEAFVQQVDAWESDREYEYQKYQDELDRKEFEQELAFKKAEAQREQANEDREYQLAKDKLAAQLAASGSSGSSSSASTKKSSSDKDDFVIYPTTYEQFVAFTGYGGIYTEAQFYSTEKAVEHYGSYQKYLQAKYDKYS